MGSLHDFAEMILILILIALLICKHHQVKLLRPYQGNEVGWLSSLGGLIYDNHLIPVGLQPLIVARSRARCADHLCNTPQNQIHDIHTHVGL